MLLVRHYKVMKWRGENTENTTVCYSIAIYMEIPLFCFIAFFIFIFLEDGLLFSV